MTIRRNHLGQPIGFDLPDWRPRPLPPRTAMRGCYCSLEPIDPSRHGPQLFEADRCDVEGASWTYLGYGPFESLPDYLAWIESFCMTDDPQFHAILDESGRAVGVASLLRIEPVHGVIEVGHIHYSPALQRRRAGTEAMYLLMRRVFDGLGYRRYEWKCDDLNEPSKRAARRLGFRYEGTFRQALIYRGRNRDTSWFSIVDQEWPSIQEAFEAWLAPDNFDDAGRQRSPLQAAADRRSSR